MTIHYDHLSFDFVAFSQTIRQTINNEVQVETSKMLKISRAQFDAFRESRIRNFEVEMVEHLRNFAPRHIQVLGEAGALEAVQFGIDRAVASGYCVRADSFIS